MTGALVGARELWRGAISRLKLWRCAQVGARPRVMGKVWIHGSGSIRIGARVVLDGRYAPIELHPNRHAVISIGDDVRIEGGASVEAEKSIVIGNRCVLRAFSKVIDNHFHPVTGDRHQRPSSVEVKIEDEVEVGVRAIVLPGAVLERGSRIGAGAVISRRVPAGASVAGAPPRVVSGSSAAPKAAPETSPKNEGTGLN